MPASEKSPARVLCCRIEPAVRAVRAPHSLDQGRRCDRAANAAQEHRSYTTSWDTIHRNEATRTERARTDDYAYKLYGSPADASIVDRTAELAESRRVNSAQVALAWVLHQPGITAPIIGMTQPDHVNEAAAAIEIELSAAELRLLDELYVPRK